MDGLDGHYKHVHHGWLSLAADKHAGYSAGHLGTQGASRFDALVYEIVKAFRLIWHKWQIASADVSTYEEMTANNAIILCIALRII